MPRRKHRMSWMYEDPSCEQASSKLEEDALAVSPVEVAFPSTDPAEECPAEECAIYEAEEPAPATDDGVIYEAEAPAADDYTIYEAEAPAREECSIYDAEPPAAEECVIREAEPPAAAEEVIVEDPPIEEAQATPEPESVPQANFVDDLKVEDSDEESGTTNEKVDEQTGEVVLVCTSCTTMLLIEYDGPCPYSFTSLLCSPYESYSWLLHTTCFSCVNKYKHEFASRDSFGNECVEAFTAAILSEEFMKRTSWFAIADRVCRKPLRIVMDEGQRSVAYGKIDVLREETTGKCRMSGLKSIGSINEDSGRNEIVNSFLPGGFI